MSSTFTLPVEITKDKITFLAYQSGTIKTVKKEDLKKAYKEFLNWRENASATNFSAELFRLMCHADYINAGRFFNGFPEESIIYSLWSNSKTEQTFKEMTEYILKEEGENDIISA